MKNMEWSCDQISCKCRSSGIPIVEDENTELGRGELTILAVRDSTDNAAWVAVGKD